MGIMMQVGEEEAIEKKKGYFSKESHAKLYIEPIDLTEKLQDIVKIIEGLLALNINLTTKKAMLHHAIWEVTKASGKEGFESRYRSAEVIKGSGENIERDHEPSRKWLVEQLLLKPEKVQEIVQSVLICVVTKSEHAKLTKYSKAHPEIKGWAKYQNCGITVYDMLIGMEL